MKNDQDIVACASEPIRIPGSIQPHGLLLAFDDIDLKVMQVSQNCATFLSRNAAQVIGNDMSDVFTEATASTLRAAFIMDDVRAANPLRLELKTKSGSPLSMDGVIHRKDGLLLVECEPTKASDSVSFGSFYHSVRQLIQPLQNSTTITDACQHAVNFVRQVTGFDRVMLYKFDEEWNGQVLAEAKRESIDSYLGQRFPAGDIPEQARELYRQNWLRLIVSSNYEPVPLFPAQNPRTGKPLDLSFSTLRSVSPVHLEYLRNMGVGASMSISIIRDDKLWGLIACHHEQARFVDFQSRSACEFVGQVFSHTTANLEAREYNADMTKRRKVLRALTSALKTSPLSRALMSNELLLALTDATGAVLCESGELTMLGTTPSPAELDRLIDWLAQDVRQELYVTTSLARSLPEAEGYKNAASGMIAATLSPAFKDFILWFKPEQISTVTWSGNPHRPMERAEDGQRINPRKSFAAWQETVRSKSEDWRASAIEAATTLAHAATAAELARTNLDLNEVVKELKRVNGDLAESNSELDAFAYIVSHDLKEPLRGIRQCTTFLLEDLEDMIGGPAVEHAQTIIDLSRRMDTQLGALYFYSRVGRVAFSMEETNLDEVARNAVEILRVSLKESHTTVRFPRPLPRVFCDSVRVGEVFQNFIVNAMRYNDRESKTIEIGYLDQTGKSQDYVFYVRDNGIGIAERHHQSIFSMFRRLHGKSEYGGGSGAGLSIVKRIIERHKGRVWLTSEVGQGTTFYFTLESSSHEHDAVTANHREESRTSIGD